VCEQVANVERSESRDSGLEADAEDRDEHEQAELAKALRRKALVSFRTARPSPR